MIHCLCSVTRGLRSMKRGVEYGEADFKTAIRVTWYMCATQAKPAKVEAILVCLLELFC